MVNVQKRYKELGCLEGWSGVREWTWVEGFSSFNVLSRRRVRARVGHPSSICNALKLKWLHVSGALAWRPEECWPIRTFQSASFRSWVWCIKPWVRITLQHSRPSPALVSASCHHGGRTHEIPPSQPELGASTGTPAQPCHIALQARINSNDMAQGEGGAATGREARHFGKEEHRGVATKGAPDLLCMRPAPPVATSTDAPFRNQTRWSLSSSDP